MVVVPNPDKFEHIRLAQESAYKLRPWSKELFFLLASFALGFIHYSLGVVCLFFAIYYSVKQISSVAHIPCPICEAPFGSGSKFTLSPGGDKCQNCGTTFKQNETE